MERLVVSIIVTVIFGTVSFISLFKTKESQQKVIKHYGKYNNRMGFHQFLNYINSRKYIITTKIVGIFAAIIFIFLILIDIALVLEI